MIVNNVGDLLEFNGELTHGDPINLVAQFKVPTLEERNAKIEELRHLKDTSENIANELSELQEKLSKLS